MKLKKYVAYFKIVLDIGCPVSGDNLETALQNARKIKETDVVDLDTRWWSDGSIKVTGVYEE